MKKIVWILALLVVFLSCQSRGDKLKLTLKGNFIKHIQEESLARNGSVKILDCDVISVDTLHQLQMDSVILKQIRGQRAYYDSMADDLLKKGNLYNHLAYNYQKASDTAQFNLAIINATDSHYMAGLFIDSSMAFQKADDLVKNNLKTETDTATFYRARIYLRATFFDNGDSTKVHDTASYHFNSVKSFIDVKREAGKMIVYDWE